MVSIHSPVQVDVRILKAVAIEHSKDADVAVEVVLSEIIPSLSRQSAVPSPPCEDTTPSLPSDGESIIFEPLVSLSEIFLNIFIQINLVPLIFGNSFFNSIMKL